MARFPNDYPDPGLAGEFFVEVYTYWANGNIRYKDVYMDIDANGIWTHTPVAFAYDQNGNYVGPDYNWLNRLGTNEWEISVEKPTLPAAPMTMSAEEQEPEESPQIAGDLEALSRLDLIATQVSQSAEGEDWTYSDEMKGYPEDEPYSNQN